MASTTAADTMQILASRNPLNGEVVGEVDVTPVDEIPAIVNASKSAQRAWSERPLAERADILGQASSRFKEEAEKLARLITLENGKVITESRLETEYIHSSIPEMLEEIVEALKPMEKCDDEHVSTIYRDPLGVAACISPWNFPLAMPHQQVIPALAAGNSVVLKPSEETPLCAQAYADILNEFLPPDVLRVVHGADAQGEALTHDDVDLIVFTGSREVGKKIHAAASDRLIRIILELGGKDPLIVLDGADIESAADYATHNTFRNTGQACISTERVYVETSIADEFIEAFVKKTESLGQGDGLDENNNVGPMINEKQRSHVIDQIERAVEQGATIASGGTDHMEGFVTPTLLTDVTHEMDIAKGETFGPVAAIIRVRDEDEAVELANDTPFGLGASVYGPLERAYTVARRLTAGMIGVNQGIRGVKGMPWVGAKESGYGFHSSPEGHRQFTQTRVVSRPRTTS